MSGEVINATCIQCSCTIEYLAKTGAVNKSLKIKTISLQIVRNEFRDIFLSLSSKALNQKLNLKDVVIHKKFVHEGKATMKFPEPSMNLFISNAPPTQLVHFLKTLFVKMCSSKSSPKMALKDKLLSVKQQVLEEVSPINAKDVKRVKAAVPDISPKRKRMDENIKDKKKICMQPLSALTEEQKTILNSVLKGSNVFFTGSAGTGKSFLLQHIINSLPPDLTVITASTGSAACLIGGTTLHSFAGIGGGDGSNDRLLQLASRGLVLQNWRRCKHLIIDEISMIESTYFEKIEWIARQVRKSDKPFGGIQLIICGDFLQLPPVSQAKKKFCFMSDAWSMCNLQTFYLKQVHRQNDPVFVSLLNSIRLGNVTNEMADRLKRTEMQCIEKEGILATRLCSHTKEADMINESKLEQLSGTTAVFDALDSSNMVKLLDDCTPVRQKISLKIGCQVMLLKNLNLSQGLVNGARGVVEKFLNGNPVVKFCSGVSHTVRREKFIVKTPNGVIHVREQLPLRLAWAFSIHKSQGLTLDCVEMRLEKTFEAGQAYVALSRAKSLETIKVIGFQSKQVWANPDVIRFYRKLIMNQTEYVKLGDKPKWSLKCKSEQF